MKFYAVTQCPTCGMKQVLVLDSPSFIQKESTECFSCGQIYSSVFNCILKTKDKEQAFKKTENVGTIASFSSEDLIRELRRREARV